MNNSLWNPLNSNKTSMMKFMQNINSKDGDDVINQDVLSNPESLDHYRSIANLSS